jgi:hypothetical protein
MFVLFDKFLSESFRLDVQVFLARNRRRNARNVVEALFDRYYNVVNGGSQSSPYKFLLY